MTEFKEHQSYKANIIKIKKRTVPVHEGRAGHLPPLNNIGGHKSASHNSQRQGDASQTRSPRMPHTTTNKPKQSQSSPKVMK